MEESNAFASETKAAELSLPEYISVHEAATIMGLSERSVYGYIEHGKLPSTKTEVSLRVRLEDVIAFQRKGPGKPRTHIPGWRLPPEPNALSLTMITVRVHPGQRKNFTERLIEMYQEKNPHLPRNRRPLYRLQSTRSRRDRHHPGLAADQLISVNPT